MRAQLGLDMDSALGKMDWHREVRETLALLKRFIMDASASLRRILEVLEQYDAGAMTVKVTFATSTEIRPVELGLREPAHAMKGSAATMTLDRLALACRSLEHPLKDAYSHEDFASRSDVERREIIDRVLGPDRETVKLIYARLQEVVGFFDGGLLAHVSVAGCAGAMACLS